MDRTEARANGSRAHGQGPPSRKSAGRVGQPAHSPTEWCPSRFCEVRVPLKPTVRKYGANNSCGGRRPSAAEAALVGSLSARLKACPDTNRSLAFGSR